MPQKERLVMNLGIIDKCKLESEHFKAEVEMLHPIIELLDTAMQGTIEVLQLLANGETEAAMAILKDLSVLITTLHKARPSNSELLEHSCTEEMLENLSDTVECILALTHEGNMNKAMMLTEFQLFPFFSQTKEAFYFWGMVYPDKDKMDAYYKEEFAEHYKNPYISDDEPPKYQLSIVVPAYNHLDKTKQCIESILNYTDFDALNAELILIDHGSNDGTLEYFESIGAHKVLHFKKNARMCMFTTMFRICEGRFFALVSNDVIVTKNWAELLLKCLLYDERIIAAVPSTPNVCNLQMLKVPTNNPQQFVTYAEQHNHYDPDCWNDRARLMFPIGMFNVKLVNRIGYADPLYYALDFWDDDFSLRARRAGYRQIVCDNVVCYHFGSATVKETQQKEGTLHYSREIFKERHNVDAWGNGFCYDYNAVNILLDTFQPLVKKEYSFLGLDCGFGDTPLQLRNIIRNLGGKLEISNITSSLEYEYDLSSISDHFQLVKGNTLVTALKEFLPEQRFDFIYLGEQLEHYREFQSLLLAIYRRMAPGGRIVLKVTNPYYALRLNKLLSFSLPETSDVYSFVSPDMAENLLREIFPKVSKIAVNNPPKGLDAFIKMYFAGMKKRAETSARLSAQEYYFLCEV